MANDNKGLTPMMRQFFEMKSKHPEALLLFRCGDFYETYCEDAVEASRILGITLTRRNNGGSTGTTEMAGFPHHALDTYLPKLIRAGKRVAVCDQLEDPKKKRLEIKGKKGLSQMDKMVKRGITELVTPGVAMGDNVLNYKENNFLAAVHFGKTACGVSFLDISTGEFLTGEGTYDYVEKLMGNFMPKEVLYDRARKNDFEKYFGSKYCTFELDDWVFTEQTALQKLLGHFKTKSLKGFGVEHLKNGVIASGAIMQYLEITQHTQINHITALSRIEEDKFVRMDRFTIRSLELVAPMQEDGSSLLNVIDRTVTAMGGRMLRRWLVFPLKDVKPINERLDIVEYFFKEPEFRQLLDDQLHRISDTKKEMEYKHVNFDHVNQVGLMLTAPINIGNWWQNRLTFTGVYQNDKNSHFYDLPFDRSKWFCQAQWNGTFLFGKHVLLNLDASVHTDAIQGIIDIPASGYLNAALTWKPLKDDKFQLKAYCNDIFETGDNHLHDTYRGQHVINNMYFGRIIGLSLIYRFGGYKVKQHEEVDTSRFGK